MQNSLKNKFNNLSPEQIRKLVASRNRSLKTSASKTFEKMLRNPEEHYPLSKAQERIWFLSYLFKTQNAVGPAYSNFSPCFYRYHSCLTALHNWRSWRHTAVSSCCYVYITTCTYLVNNRHTGSQNHTFSTCVYVVQHSRW